MDNAHLTDVSARADNFIPLLRDRADGIEEARRLPADMAHEMAHAGMFRLLTPEWLGGEEATPQVFSHVLQTLARGDASSSWCAMIASTAALVSAWLDKETAQEIFADPDVILAGIYAPMGKALEEGDHYRVSGRWQWGSGSANCAWLSGGSMIFRDGAPVIGADGKPETRMMIFPSTDVELIDTWHVAGLKGTGSGDMAVTDVLVPKARSVSLTAGKPITERPLYVFPVFGLLALGIASVALGNARAALDDVTDLIRNKKPPIGKPMAARATVQAAIAQAEASYGSTRSYLADAIAKNWAAAVETGELTPELRAELRLACVHATRESAEITRVAYDLGGGASVFLGNTLQRRFRDGHVMTQHIMVAPPIYELAGRVLLGQETDISML